MSDGESHSSHPPSLEDAEFDDVSSNGSFISDTSDSVSINTEASDESDYSSSHSNHYHAVLGSPIVVPPKEEDSDSDVPSRQVGNGTRVRRQSSSSGRTSALRPTSKNMGGEDGPRRRAPPRTKSGDFCGGPPRRRAPHRTKSGGAMTPVMSNCGRKVSIEEDQDDADRKEQTLRRNAARRQKSSEMLRAMQDATRKAPNRSKSSGATLQRRAPTRTKSGAVLAGGHDNRPRRRAPARTKSGDGLGPRRRPPQRTKSGGGLS